MTAVPSALPRRERARAATIDEIKRTALDLMRAYGTTDVRFTDIAREMGMTPPALYRYFDDRDALLTVLITDAYRDLGQSVAEAQEAVAREDVGGRWRAGAQAYRRWALNDPRRFALIFGLPVPGFCPPEEGETTEAARWAMSQLSNLFVEAQAAGRLGRPYSCDVDPALAVCAEGKSEDLGVVLPSENFQAMLHAWAAIHGFACLEAYGHLDWMTPEGRDALFVSQVCVSARAAGLPEPDGPASG
ncbi:MAG: TetR/AcrR family transcriptional regulator [Actinomycetes bacterium]